MDGRCSSIGARSRASTCTKMLSVAPGALSIRTFNTRLCYRILPWTSHGKDGKDGRGFDGAPFQMTFTGNGPWKCTWKADADTLACVTP